MTSIRIPIETPASLCDIDFRALASTYQGQVDVITDLEGTVTAWGLHAADAQVGGDIIEALTEATYNGYLRGAHGMTNRGRAGGARLTGMFSRTMEGIAPADQLTCHTAYPQFRSERKPHGVMGDRIVTAITRRRLPSEVIIAFVGDKFSDMQEAEHIRLATGVTVVGFMVERYGATDHPLDTLFGKRQQATAQRERLSAISRNRFVR